MNEGFDIGIQSLGSVMKGRTRWHGDYWTGEEWEVPYDFEGSVPIFPTKSEMGANTYGLANIENHLEEFNADLHFTHFDSWMAPARQKIPDTGWPYASYIIVDHHPAPNAVVEQVMGAQKTISMSKYAKHALEQKGVRSTYIPHGVHTDVYKPLPDDELPSKMRYEDEYGRQKEMDLQERFVVGMVAANHGDRKNIPNQMEAFKRFLEEVDDEALLYIHTNQKSARGYDLYEIQQEIGIPDENIKWPSESQYHGVGDEYMNMLYNLFDVYLNCSMGESWGLTITEAQSAGTPCIVTNFSSMPEQLGVHPRGEIDWKAMRGTSPSFGKAKHGLVVEPRTHIYREKVSARQYICDPDDIFAAMRYYYHNRKEIGQDGQDARDYVIDNYDWEREVVPEFVDMFKRIEV